MKFQNILVPIDFSEFSSNALNYAIGLAEKFHSKLILLHAVVLFEDDVNEEQRLQEYEEWVRKREKNINAHMKEKIVRLSPIPVLSVHRSVQNFRIENIIAPIDFSIYSKNAADYAISIAENFKAQVNFIHVIEKEIHPSFYASGVESIFQIDTGLQDRVIQNMQGFLEEQLNSDIKPRFMVKEGHAHREIVEYAKEEKADLIVISTHGLTGLEYLLLGSTTEKVVRWASCPVLTLKTNK
ncbi:MAG: universal stress protein [Calditrichota bacterium]